uniref:Serpentine receptor class gamma n=1 Tax=Caenorhabditis tropicalis TaxID=1561998 RepID=A0A1I7U3P5_9PELO
MARPYISILIIVISMIFASAYSLIFAFNFFTFLVTSVLIALVTAASVTLYIFVYYYNTRIKTMSDNNNKKEKYTLARRFQTMENLKSLKMAKYVVSTHAIYVSLCEICYLCVYYGVRTNYWEIFIYILDAVVTYSNFFIVITVIFSVPTWKRAFLRPCFAVRRMKTMKVSMTEEDDGRNPEEDARKISSVYFQQLDRAWT